MLTLTSPGSPVRQINGAVNRLFHDFLGEFPAWPAGAAAGVPSLDLWEEENSLQVEMELPGYTMKEVEVFVHGDHLRIRGERELPNREGVTWHRRERAAGTFERTIALPYEVDAERVEATLQSGVLRLLLPKSEHEMPRKIEVKALSGS